MSEAKDFLGSGLKFPLQIDKATGYIAMSSHEEDIEEAIQLIIHTAVGERVMRPDFGSAVKDYVFSDKSLESLTSIQAAVMESLSDFEPRISNLEVKTDNMEQKNGIMLTIQYTVRATNNQFNMVYPYYLLEGEGM